jgi:hypothetical protein
MMSIQSLLAKRGKSQRKFMSMDISYLDAASAAEAIRLLAVTDIRMPGTLGWISGRPQFAAEQRIPVMVT